FCLLPALSIEREVAILTDSECRRQVVRGQPRCAKRPGYHRALCFLRGCPGRHQEDRQDGHQGRGRRRRDGCLKSCPGPKHLAAEAGLAAAVGGKASRIASIYKLPRHLVIALSRLFQNTDLRRAIIIGCAGMTTRFFLLLLRLPPLFFKLTSILLLTCLVYFFFSFSFLFHLRFFLSPSETLVATR
ncbi:hypothetical protein H103_04931, partial [Trichophyton rubrum CBS 288.86]